MSSIDSEKLCRAALAGETMNDGNPWFFVMIYSRDIMEQTASLADIWDIDADLLVVCFASMTEEQSVLDTTLAMGRMMQAVQEEGLCVRLERWLSRVFESPAYSGLAGAMGVPAGYFCIGGFSVDESERGKNDVKHSEDVFAVIR